MTPETPFPTVQRLSVLCGAEWQGFATAEQATVEGEARLQRALAGISGGGLPFGGDSALILFGSFARREMTTESDYEDFRAKLKNLSHSEATSCPAFGEVRRLGSDFASGLKLLFFNRESDPDPISNLSLDYVGF